MSDYTDSGFDSFLSRSIDSMPQSTLDSSGPYSTQMRYDSAQISGAIGDKFAIGGMKLSGKENSFTINDGSIAINSTDNDSVIQASNGLIIYQDNTGQTVIREGILDDNTVGLEAFDAQQKLAVQLGRFPQGGTGIRILDPNGLGVAQFGRYSNGTTALKIAQSGYDAATATDDQLIFNSNNNIFKIVSTKTITASNVHVNPASSFAQTNLAHGLSYTPAFIAFITLDPALQAFAGVGLNNHPNPAITFGASGGFAVMLAIAEVSVDGTNIALSVQLGGGNPSGTYNTSAKVYLLQETFS